MTQTHEHISDDLILELIDGSLGADEMGRVRDHLGHCAVCNAVHESLLRFDTSMRSLPVEGLGPAFTAKVMAQLDLSLGFTRALRFLEIVPHILGLTIVLGTMLMVFVWTGVVDASRFSGEEGYFRGVAGEASAYLSGVLGTASGWLSDSLPFVFGSKTIHISISIVAVLAILAGIDRGIGRRLVRKM